MIERASQEESDLCNSCDVLMSVLNEMCGPRVSQVIMRRAVAELHDHEATPAGTAMRQVVIASKLADA